MNNASQYTQSGTTGTEQNTAAVHQQHTETDVFRSQETTAAVPATSKKLFVSHDENRKDRRQNIKISASFKS